jgi:hypothetical protein
MSFIVGYLDLPRAFLHNWVRESVDTREKTDCLFRMFAFPIHSEVILPVVWSCSGAIPWLSCLAFFMSD